MSTTSSHVLAVTQVPNVVVQDSGADVDWLIGETGALAVLKDQVVVYLNNRSPRRRGVGVGVCRDRCADTSCINVATQQFALCGHMGADSKTGAKTRTP